MKIAWTTTETFDQARRLSLLAVEKNLAVCAQISGPLTSLYRWKGKIEESAEFRITLKCLDEHFPQLEQCILDNHPYDIPQWVAIAVSEVGDRYRSWAEGSFS